MLSLTYDSQFDAQKYNVEFNLTVFFNKKPSPFTIKCQALGLLQFEYLSGYNLQGDDLDIDDILWRIKVVQMRMKLRRDINVKFEKRHEFTKQISIG